MNRLIFSLGFVVLWLAADWTPAAELFVAVDGNDVNDGSQTQPFATLARAQLAVRKLLAGGYDQDVFVTVGSGTYFLDEPLQFTAADSGRGDQHVTYRGVEKEGRRTIISGGRVLSAWQVRSDKKWQTQIVGAKASSRLRQLFADGQRLPRGRFPNGEKMLTILEVDETLQRIVVDQPLPTGQSPAVQGELVVHKEWGIDRTPVVSIDGAIITTGTPAGWLGHISLTRATAGRPLYLENIPEFVDVAGEWCHDFAKGEILYQPKAGEKPDDRQFVVPRLSQLLIVEGKPGKPVRNLRFINLRFEMAAWQRPEFGYAGIQAGHYGRSLDSRTWELPAALAFTFAEGCELEETEVRCTGTTAIALGAGCHNNRIAWCRIDDVGGNGIVVGWRSGTGSFISKLLGDASLEAGWEKPEYAPTGNVVADNEISRCAQIAHGCVGIYDAFSQGTRIQHNHVHQLPYSAISIGFQWNFTAGTHRDCLVEANHVHDVMRVLADGGGIYTLGHQPGTVIRNNLIHHVSAGLQSEGKLNNGFFFDQGSQGYTVTGNCVYDVAGEFFRFNNVKQVPGEKIEFIKPIGKKAMLQWTENVFGVKPGEAGFPQTTADAAGPRKR